MIFRFETLDNRRRTFRSKKLKVTETLSGNFETSFKLALFLTILEGLEVEEENLIMRKTYFRVLYMLKKNPH